MYWRQIMPERKYLNMKTYLMYPQSVLCQVILNGSIFSRGKYNRDEIFIGSCRLWNPSQFWSCILVNYISSMGSWQTISIVHYQTLKNDRVIHKYGCRNRSSSRWWNLMGRRNDFESFLLAVLHCLSLQEKWSWPGSQVLYCIKRS